MDNNLGCIRLQWQKHDGEIGKKIPSKQFGLTTVDVIRGIVNNVLADVEFDIVTKDNLHRQQYEKLRISEIGWAENI